MSLRRESSRFVVVVTYGSRRTQVYSFARTKADAKALCTAAKDRGFADAHVISVERYDELNLRYAAA